MTRYSYGWGVERLLEKENSFSYFAWSPYYSPIMEHLKVLATPYAYDVINPITKKTGCAVDIFIYCTGGILSLITGIVIIITIIFIIWKKLFSQVTVNT